MVVTLAGWCPGSGVDGRATGAADAGGSFADYRALRQGGWRHGSGLGHCSEWFPHLVQVSKHLHAMTCTCSASFIYVEEAVFLL